MEWPRTAIIRFKISAPSGTSLTLNLSRSGNQNVGSGFFLPLEIQCFPVAEDWHSGTASTGWLRSATGTNARILANPAPLRNCIRNTKRQQWRTDSPKKLPTLPLFEINYSRFGGDSRFQKSVFTLDFVQNICYILSLSFKTVS